MITGKGRRSSSWIWKTPPKIPAIAEPWFLAFNARIEMHPVMVARRPDEGGASYRAGRQKVHVISWTPCNGRLERTAYAPWLNEIEIWFGIYTRDVIRV
jgi:hypothetical protein